ncbi:MAG: N-acetyldiaminopimelate deacetylase [Caryophanon sp.]|nr:N-acetyldiaminopimelate deacetylase [Caryophanon sp.]
MMDLIKVRQALHMIPEAGFAEFKTQRYLLECIAELPQQWLTVTTWQTGIVVRVAGYDATKTIGWRADMDGLPIHEQTDVAYASTHDGFMHACGHDCHMTIALGLLARVTNEQPKNNIIVYFQPAEENPGGAEPMLAWLKAEQSDLLPDVIFAAHVAPQYPVGTIATKPGLLFANTSELYINITSVGGHAAFPHDTKDASVIAANLLLQLQTIVARNVNPLDSAVVTIGKMTSGTVQNVISGAACLEGTIRTTTPQTMNAVKRRIEAICAGVAASFECIVDVDYGSGYYEVNNTPQYAEALLAFAGQFERTAAYACPAAMTGEDFGYFLKDIPGALFWTGANTAYGLHHEKMLPDETLLHVNADFVHAFLTSL